MKAQSAKRAAEAPATVAAEAAHGEGVDLPQELRPGLLAHLAGAGARISTPEQLGQYLAGAPYHLTLHRAALAALIAEFVEQRLLPSVLSPTGGNLRELARFYRQEGHTVAPPSDQLLYRFLKDLPRSRSRRTLHPAVVQALDLMGVRWSGKPEGMTTGDYLNTSRAQAAVAGAEKRAAKGTRRAAKPPAP